MVSKPQKELLDSIRDYVGGKDGMCLVTETLAENSFVVYPWDGNVPYIVKVVKAQIIEQDDDE